jgi:hypothetical protein
MKLYYNPLHSTKLYSLVRHLLTTCFRSSLCNHVTALNAVYIVITILREYYICKLRFVICGCHVRIAVYLCDTHVGL